MFTSYKFDHTVRHADTCLYYKQQGARTRMAYCYLNKLILSNVRKKKKKKKITFIINFG